MKVSWISMAQPWINFVIHLGYYCPTQPKCYQGAYLFHMNEFRIIKMVLSTLVMIFVALWRRSILQLLSFLASASLHYWRYTFKCVWGTGNAVLTSNFRRLFILDTVFSLLVSKESVSDVTILPLARDTTSLSVTVMFQGQLWQS